MAVTNTDAVLWYNVGNFGKAGYAVPNWSNDFGTLNPNIASLVNLVGSNLFTIMQYQDADLSTPPSINTLTRIHRLYLRYMSILASRAVPPGTPDMETEHSRPAGQVFLVYPCPYFAVRNPYMQYWAGLILMMLAEMMQHTENRKEVEISTTFANDVGQYMKRVYQNMCIELFQKPKATVIADGFALQDADLASYDPTKFFTSVEMTDTVPPLNMVFTEDELSVLRAGIPISQLPDAVQPWPLNLTNAYSASLGDGNIVAGGVAAGGSNASTSQTTAAVIPGSGTGP